MIKPLNLINLQFLMDNCMCFQNKTLQQSYLPKVFSRKYYRDRHIKEIHPNNSLIYTICNKTYSLKNDLKKHQIKYHPSNHAESSSTPAPMDWDIPQSFYDLLESLEQDPICTDEQPSERASQSFNKGIQTSGGKIITAPITKHLGTNTDLVQKLDKSTNPDPLIILEPNDIDKLTNGFKLLCFDSIPRIYLSTTNSSIKPCSTQTASKSEPNYVPKYIPSPISKEKPRVERRSE